MNCSLPGSSAHGIFQARILEWAHWSGPFPTLGDLPDPGIKPESCASPALAGGFFTNRATKSIVVLGTWLFQAITVFGWALKLACMLSHSVMSDSFWTHGLWPILCPWFFFFFQARILEEGVISYGRGSLRPRYQTQVSCVGRWIHYH